MLGRCFHIAAFQAAVCAGVLSLGYLRRSVDLSGDLLNFLRDIGGRAAQQYRRVAR